MRYPKCWLLINNAIAIISGALILLIGCIAVMESIIRGFFARPTLWSMDISLYLLIWALFLGSAYSFQEKGHVAVDLIREKCSKKTRRILSIIGYISQVQISV